MDEVTGETIKGLRKYAPSKQHQPAPLIEMGLFMGGDGIPLSMCITSGSLNIRNFNSMSGRAFIVTQPIKKLSEVLQEAVFNDCDYRLLSSDNEISIETLKEFDKNDPANRDLYSVQVRLGVLAARCASCFAWHNTSAHLCNPP